MGFLSVLGLIFLLMIGKFIWDTYLQQPSEQAPVPGRPSNAGKSPNGSVKGNIPELRDSNSKREASRQHSLRLLARNLDCDPAQVKEAYLAGVHTILESSGVAEWEMVEPLETLLAENSAGKHAQSVEMGMHPDDTVAGIAESWILELLYTARARTASLFEAQNKAFAPRTGYGLVTVKEVMYNTRYTDRQHAVIGYTQENGDAGGAREFYETLSVDEIAQSNDGNGLEKGDMWSSHCLSKLHCPKPFFAAQPRDEATGLYSITVKEWSDDNQPNDRFVFDSEGYSDYVKLRAAGL
jgi:hypothetical protein